MVTSKKQYAVITHATSVLGRAYALELAKREINLVLISWPGEELEDTARDLKDLGIDVRFYETDLASHRNLADVALWINFNFEVALIININNTLPRVSKSVRDVRNYPGTISQLNVMSVSLLTRELLPNLIRQRKSYILNVSDFNVFDPLDLRIRYRSLLTFVNHFTRGLRRDLRDTNVFVSQVYVWAMQKNIGLSDPVSRISGGLRRPAPERIAATSIRRLFRRQTAIIPSVGYGIGWIGVPIAGIWARLCSLTTLVKREANRESAFGWLRKN